MTIRVKAMCSGSSGNSYLIWTNKTAILIDFGISAQYRCWEALAAVTKVAGRISSVFVTHAHPDHINYSSLKVLAESGVKVRCPRAVRGEIEDRYGDEYSHNIASFSRGLTIGDLNIRHIAVEHSPSASTYAYSVTTSRRGREYKATLFTDFRRFTDEHVEFARDSDVIMLETSYDLHMYQTSDNNYGCQYHMPNHKAAAFLHKVCDLSESHPKTVILGHLSERCNKRHLPPKAIARHFKEHGTSMGFSMQVAEKHVPSRLVAV
jgi:ribonuclease BN (tRNA processing enzyme)